MKDRRKEILNHLNSHDDAFYFKKSKRIKKPLAWDDLQQAIFEIDDLKDNLEKAEICIKEACKQAITEEMHGKETLKMFSLAYPLSWSETLIKLIKNLRDAIDVIGIGEDHG